MALIWPAITADAISAEKKKIYIIKIQKNEIFLNKKLIHR